jgi:hypothetical protein
MCEFDDSVVRRGYGKATCTSSRVENGMRDTLISFCDTARENHTQQQGAAGRDLSVMFSDAARAHARRTRRDR